MEFDSYVKKHCIIVSSKGCLAIKQNGCVLQMKKYFV